MNRQKREEALHNGTERGKSPDQPGRSNQPDRDKVHGSKGAQETQKPQREPGKLPLPE